MGKNIWFSHGNSRSAGVAILQGNFNGQVLHYEVDDGGRWIVLLVDISHFQFILINIYASNNKQYNAALFQNIERKINLLKCKGYLGR